MKSLIFLVLVTIYLHNVKCEEGDYVNQFVASVSDESQLEDVVHHLKKRSALVTATINTDSGWTVHFRHDDFRSRSKRFAVGHPTFADFSHIGITSIEQQRELVRDKRDYFTDEQLALARKTLIEMYREEMQKKKLKENKKDGKHEYRILHDKQLELDDQQRYYKDKSVFRRYESDNMKSLVSKDYIPGEDRTINLNDEYVSFQWYLMNNGQAGGPKGLDVNVIPAWQQGYSGKGVTVCILDDGVDHEHDDLRANYSPEASTDLNSGDNNPEPNPDNLDENSHGTKCAGEVAAVANNSICGVGIAFSAKVGGVRILDGPVTDSLEAQALLFNNQVIDIYSASWGPRDNGKVMEMPNKGCRDALAKGCREGRGGKGSIYVWATGNGGANEDDCSADGYVGDIHTLSVGSINNYAESTYFMEWCPSTMAVIYTGGYHSVEDIKFQQDKEHPILKVVTTDVRNKCTLNFQGTSSAAPLAAGAMAVVLEANPELTWRDLQHLVVHTAKIPNTIEQGWTINGAGLHVNDKFGYGAIDVAQMVQLAQDWPTVSEQHICKYENLSSTEDSAMVFSSKASRVVSADLDGCQSDSEHRIDKLEHVQLYIKIKHPRRGDVKITLTSPAGTPSEMLSTRKYDDSTSGIDFIFMTVRCWNENPRGNWVLNITDIGETDGGELLDWALVLYGTSLGEKQRDADNHKALVKPEKDDLDAILKTEMDNAEYVKIEKSSSEDIIERFATKSINKKSDVSEEIRRIFSGKSQKEVAEIANMLKKDFESAKKEKRVQQEREVENLLKKFLETV